MQPATQTAPVSKASLWTARILLALIVLFMLFDGVTKVMKESHVMAASVQLGLSASATVGIGIVGLVSTALYVIPRTAILGAILLTGYLGGAIATQVRIGASFSFPVVFGVLIWVALYLTDVRLRTLVPLRR